MSINEFDKKTKKLKADWLFVVGNLEKQKPVLYKIPRQAIQSEYLKLKQTFQIIRFQNKRTMSEYIES